MIRNSFIDMVRNIDFLFGFIYECTNLEIIYTSTIIMII